MAQGLVDTGNITNTELSAILVELRMLNQNTVIIGSGQVLTDDPNVYRLDAAAQGYYTNPPIPPLAGQS